MEENIINNGQREKLHGISGTSKAIDAKLSAAEAKVQKMREETQKARLITCADFFILIKL